MTALFISFSLLVIFLILDRLQGFYNRKKNRIQEELNSKLNVLKVITKHECLKKHGEDYEEWLGRFLAMQGYEEVKFNREEERSYDLSCRHRGQTVYIDCRLNNADTFEKPVSRADLQRLVGAMVGDRVRRGLVITAGEVAPEAHAYVEKLPRHYRVKIIDGDLLVSSLYDLRKVKLEPLYESR